MKNAKLEQIIQEYGEALQEVAKATESYRSAEFLASRARTDEVAALNRLNEAQKKADALDTEWRKLSPRDSDWGGRVVETGSRQIAKISPPLKLCLKTTSQRLNLRALDR